MNCALILTKTIDTIYGKTVYTCLSHLFIFCRQASATNTAAVLDKKKAADSGLHPNTFSGAHLEPSQCVEEAPSTSPSKQHPPAQLRSKPRKQVKPKTTPVRRVVYARSTSAGGYQDEPTDIKGSMQHLAEVRHYARSTSDGGYQDEPTDIKGSRQHLAEVRQHDEDEAADLQTSVEASDGASPQERGQE